MFGDSGCGSVDCINEAACAEQLPTVVLDSRSSGLSDSISQYLKKSGFKRTFSRFLIRTATLVSPRLKGVSWYEDYIDALSADDKLHWFTSLLGKYPNREMPSLSEEVLPVTRSCVVVWRVPSLTTISEKDIETWQHLQDTFPSILFVLTCSHGPLSEHEAISSYSAPLYVGRRQRLLCRVSL